MAQKKKPERDNCSWTQEEDDFLLDSVGTSSYDFIASRLKRSPRAVENRLREIDTSDLLMLTGMLSAADLARLVKRNKTYIVHLIKEHRLPASQKSLRYKKKETKGLRYFIDPYKFWKWAEKNRDKLNFYLIEPDSIPPEPKWVAKQRAEDYQKPVTRKRWTEDEKKRAIELLNTGYSRPQVAKVFNRSVSSIRWVLDKHLEEVGAKKK